MVRDRLSRDRAPLRAGAGGARQDAEGGHPHLLLREGRPALLQQRGGGRCRRRDPRRLPQEPHPRRPRLSREILFPARRHRLQGVADARRHRSASAFAGINGTRRRPAPWCWKAPRSCFIRPPSAQSRKTSTLDTHLQWQRAMQGHAVANAVPIVAANRIGLEDNDGAEAELLRPFLHRRPQRRAGGELRRPGRRRAGCTASISTRSRATAPIGDFSATAAPTSTTRPSASSRDSSTTSRAALFEPGKPAADRIEQHQHQQPDHIDAEQAQTDSGIARERAGHGKADATASAWIR